MCAKDVGLSLSHTREIARTHNISKKKVGRKVYYNAQELYTAVSEEITSTSPHQELKRAKRQLRTYEKEKQLSDRIIQIVKTSTQSIPVEAFTHPRRPRVDTAKNVETAVLQFGDIHIGEIVDALEVYGLNQYNFDVFKRRLQCLVDTIIHLCFDIHKGQTFDGLIINALGDMVSGYIHEEFEITGEGSMIQWALGGAYIMAQATLELAARFPHVTINCVVGNHGRTQKQKRYKRRYVNWDTIFYEAWAAYCKRAKNVSFNIPRSFFMTTIIQGQRCVVLHGDDIRGWMGIPYYGINRAVGNFTQLMRSIGHDFTYFMLGHFHESADLQNANGDIIVNGSFIGGNEYSIGKLGKCAPPRQLLLGMNSDGVSFEYKIRFKKKFYPDKSRYTYDPDKSVAEQRR
jgi:hypothetical protein